VAAPEAEPQATAEERARAHFQERAKFFDRVWKSGVSGKVFVILVLLAIAAPFIFELFAVFAVWLWLWPVTVTVTEKLGTLSFLFVALNVMAWQVARWAVLLWEYAYIMRPQRRKQKGKVPGREGPA